MNKQYRRIAGLLCIFALIAASCSQELVEDALVEDGKAIAFNFGISQTRTSTEGKKTVFVNNDRLGIMGTKRGTTEITHKNLNYLYADGKWSAEYSITFPVDGSILNFYAYYPFVADLESTEFDFTVASDQSVADGYNQSDLLLAKNETAKVEDTSITLTFVHKLALVETTVILPAGAEIESVSLRAKRTASVDLLTQVVAVKNDVEAEFVTMTKVGNVFRAVVPAQNIESGKMFRVLTTDGGAYWYKATANEELIENKITYFTIDCSH